MARDQAVIEVELDAARAAWSKGGPGTLERCHALEAELAEAAVAVVEKPRRKRTSKRAASDS